MNLLKLSLICYPACPGPKPRKQQIPQSLVECIEYLINYGEETDIFKKLPEIEALAIYHHTTGRSIRNEWGLWDNSSKLHKEFNKIGIFHPDDMLGIIMTTLHRILNSKPIKLKDQIESYKEYWRKV